MPRRLISTAIGTFVTVLLAGCGSGVPTNCADQRCAPSDRSEVLHDAHRLAGRQVMYWIDENGNNAGSVEPYSQVRVAEKKGSGQHPRGSAVVPQLVRPTPDISATVDVVTYIAPPVPDFTTYGAHYVPLVPSITRLLLRRRMSSGETVEVWGSGDLTKKAGNNPEYEETRAYVEAHLRPVNPKLFDKLSDFEKG